MVNFKYVLIASIAGLSAFTDPAAQAQATDQDGYCFNIDAKPLCLESVGKIGGQFHYRATYDGKAGEYVRRSGVLTTNARGLPSRVEVAKPHARLWKLANVTEIRVDGNACVRSGAAPGNLTQITEMQQDVQAIAAALPTGLRLPEGVYHVVKIGSAVKGKAPYFAYGIGKPGVNGYDHFVLRSEDGVSWIKVAGPLKFMDQGKPISGGAGGIAVSASGQVFVATPGGLMKLEQDRLEPVGTPFDAATSSGRKAGEVQISADGKTLAVAAVDQVKIYDLAADGALSRERVINTAAIGGDGLALTIDPKGNLIVGGGLGSGEEVVDAKGHSSYLKGRSQGVLYCDATTLQCKDAVGPDYVKGSAKAIYPDTLFYNFSIEGDTVYASTCNKPYRAKLSDLQAGKPVWTRSVSKAKGEGNGGQPSMRNYVITARPGHPDEVVAGSATGLYRSTDGGQNWQRLRGEADGVSEVRTAQWLTDGSVVYSSQESGAARVARDEMGGRK